MKIFTFTLKWDQAINHFFDQDDCKTVGKRRVRGEAVVVAPDRELAELFLLRSFSHRETSISSCSETAINLFVESNGRTITPVSDAKPIGPEHIDPHWKKVLANER